MSRPLLARLVRKELAPPRYLSLPAVGIAVSASGVKLAEVREKAHGLELAMYAEAPLPLDAVQGGSIVDRASIVEAIRTLAKAHRVRFAHIALPETKSYLFETEASGSREAVCGTIAARLEEYVPLPRAEVAFDALPVESAEGDGRAVAVAYAHQTIAEFLSVFDEAGVRVRSVESEVFSMARALLARGSEETVLVIDIGRTTTKVAVISYGVPRFATTLDIGGHAVTLAVQKHFNVSEDEARRIKMVHGLARSPGSEEYVTAMLSTISAIREEVGRTLEYWQSRAGAGTGRAPVTRAILIGANASVQGLAEYFETGFKIPVALGDVFTNLAPRTLWLPSLEQQASLGYATALGLALRDYGF